MIWAGLSELPMGRWGGGTKAWDGEGQHSEPADNDPSVVRFCSVLRVGVNLCVRARPRRGVNLCVVCVPVYRTSGHRLAKPCVHPVLSPASEPAPGA